MINIGIVDDEDCQITYLTTLVRKWEKERDNNIRLLTYQSAESFLFHYEDDKTVDILLLDVQMKEMDGVELAHHIRKDNESMQIIFITGFPDFMAEGFEVAALHYLIKPVKEKKLFEVLDKAVMYQQKASRFILLPKSGGNMKVNADEIIYAEVCSHTVNLHLINGVEEFKMRISDMEQLLGEGFFKCHRSYIVSMKYVRRVTKSFLILTNGVEIPLSRSLYDTANQAFIHYN